MLRRAVPCFATALTLLFAVPASAEPVTVLDQDGNAVETISKGACKVKGKGKDRYFEAKAKSPQYVLDVAIDGAYEGFGETYPLILGAGLQFTDPFVSLTRTADGMLFSNYYPVPGPVPIVGAGGIKFTGNGKSMRIGFSPLPNKSYAESVSFGGSIKCKYPKKGK